MRWPHYQHVFFDCDSTLSTIEGIDILAETVGKKWRIEVLTNAAMNGNLDLEDVYGKRLQAVKATHAQVKDIRRAYKRNIVEDAQEVIAALQALEHKVYIISGGLAEPVAEFGIFLGVPRENIRAVTVDYDKLSGIWWQKVNEYQESGDERYLTFEDSDLTVTDGKANVVKELLGEQNGRSILIGDGSSDLMAGTAVNLFTGFGGVVARDHVQEAAPAFVHSNSLAPFLVLAAGPAAIRRIRNTPHELVFKKGLSLIKTGAISFKDERLKEKFNKAYQALHSRAY
ncbi:MAG: HAD-IB family phosphatase [Chloroflexi bacterium]|nr:HAD-IB family phosphatase [Chloroflexota bacterium]